MSRPAWLLEVGPRLTVDFCAVGHGCGAVLSVGLLFGYPASAQAVAS